jgi:hypothetical protein
MRRAVGSGGIISSKILPVTLNFFTFVTLQFLQIVPCGPLSGSLAGWVVARRPLSRISDLADRQKSNELELSSKPNSPSKRTGKALKWDDSLYPDYVEAYNFIM